MIYLPDTNALIRFLNPGQSPVKDHFLSVNALDIRICSVVKAELYYGAMKSSCSTNNLVLLDEFFSNFDSLPFDDDAARKYGEIRSALARQGTPIGPNDLMISATALVHGAVVVTHNIREFSRVDGLKIVDWEEC
ncbi:MAG TPA: type II toxin-antitoxin system VapC family toxin [Desulfuromonadales bacterium]|nr:type II toxin-antitoxin system VapC family toxin [Desulfuromonadales bacterium]